MKIEKRWVYFFLSFTYLELLFKLVVYKNIFDISIINITLFNLFLSTFICLICSISKEKTNRILGRIIIFISSFIFMFQECIHSIFGFYFTFNLFGAAGQTLEFASDIINVIVKNIIWIILFLVPFILSFVLKKIISYEQNSKNILTKLLSLSIAFLGLFYCSLLIGNNKDYSSYKLYFEYNDTALSVEKLGVSNSFYLDIVKYFTHFEENINIVTPIEQTPVEEETIKYEYNNLDIDFNSLANSETNATRKQMDLYFASETGTLQNEYTGVFEGKNLILFMAESFNEVAVREELTPTLYKLTHEGFVFNNFYTPTISSTIGGEFQELTGLYAANGFVTPWKNGNNSFPMGISTVFEKMDYNTYAYHNHSYVFQNRNKYLKALGFDNFLGCFNGLEKKINCHMWPESDVELIDATIDDYINSENPFMVFYATVSGHGDYSFSGHAIAAKNKSLVKELNYSEKVKVYLAAQIELDKALEDLINRLDEAGKLSNTVIALVGDHYPYFLSASEVNEMSDYKKDSVVEINHSNFILWNSKMKTVNIDKVGSQIDVLPTLYNLFKVEYDSRIIIGKDILSPEPGLAMFANRSWVSDYGTYFASSGNFIPNEGVEIPEDYVAMMNNKVSNRINMSKLILTENYYKYVLGD